MKDKRTYIRPPKTSRAYLGVLMVALFMLFRQPLQETIITESDTEVTASHFDASDAPQALQASFSESKHTLRDDVHLRAPKNEVSAEKNFKQRPSMNMPIGELLDLLVADDDIAALWGIGALSVRQGEAAPFIEDMLLNGSPWEQYSLARRLRDARPEHHRETLLMLVLSEETHPQARVGACYALSKVSLDATAAKEILVSARNAASSIHCQTALIALSQADLSYQENALKQFVKQDDPLTSLYAARLLLERGETIDRAHVLSLASHPDHIVRQEAYGVLACYDEPAVTGFLHKAAVNETNLPAARSARVALRLQKLTEDVPQEEAALTLLDTDDDLECWQGIQYALRRDRDVGHKALALLAQSDSPLAEMALAQLYAGVFQDLQDMPDPPYSGNKHFTSIHESMASYNVALHNTQPTLPKITETAAATFAQATILEDIGIQPVNHAYNPLTKRGFLRQQGFGGSAYLYVDSLLADLHALCGQTKLSDSDLYAAWTLTGRVFHVLQDMASPLHVFSVWHVLNGCHFELYWYPRTDEALQLVNALDVEPTSLPQIPSAALQALDSQTRTALEKRITALPNTLAAYQDALAWCAYYRASFWGEIRYAEEASTAQTTATQFDDQETEALPNTLSLMFENNIRYHPSWWNDYFEITDRTGNSFVWNRLFALDDWRPCPNPRKQRLIDGHTSTPVILDNGDRSLRITGRFHFTHKGSKTPYCHPYAYPDGTPMTEHLVQYYGACLFPVMVAYGGGWLAELASTYPHLFESEMNFQKRDSKNEETLQEGFMRALNEVFYGKETLPQDHTSGEDTLQEYFRLYAPRCGCVPYTKN